MSIDAHVHVWTDDRRRYPRITGEAESRPDRFTPEDYFSHARPAGVTRAVLIQMSFYRFDNSYMLDTIRAHPGKFSGVGIVDSTSSNPGQAMEDLAKRGVRGFRITPGNSPNTWLETPGMDAMWRTGAKRKLAMCLLVNPNALGSIDRMCAKHPDTPVVIDHLARVGGDGEIRDADIRLLCGLAKHRNAAVKVSAFYALVLLCYKRGGPQKGQQGSCLRMDWPICLRSVAIDAGLCRSGRTRTARAEAGRELGR